MFSTLLFLSLTTTLHPIRTGSIPPGLDQVSEEEYQGLRSKTAKQWLASPELNPSIFVRFVYLKNALTELDLDLIFVADLVTAEINGLLAKCKSSPALDFVDQATCGRIDDLQEIFRLQFLKSFANQISRIPSSPEQLRPYDVQWSLRMLTTSRALPSRLRLIGLRDLEEQLILRV